jgi:hypothetical protein
MVRSEPELASALGSGMWAAGLAGAGCSACGLLEEGALNSLLRGRLRKGTMNSGALWTAVWTIFLSCLPRPRLFERLVWTSDCAAEGSGLVLDGREVLAAEAVDSREG